MKQLHHACLLATILAFLFAAGVFLKAPTKAEADFPASDLSTSLVFDCLPGNQIRVHLQWATYGQGLQWVDLSVFNNDFAPGTFLSLGPLSPAQSSFAWDGLLPGVLH